MAETDSDPEIETYDRLMDKIQRVQNIREARRMLEWDQQTMMPSEGTAARTAQLSTLSEVEHEELVTEETGSHLAALQDRDLSPTQRAVVREVQREYDRKTSVPMEIVSEIKRVTSEANDVWQAARQADDFERFEPKLQELIDLKRAYANHIAPDRDPYAVLFEEYEPYLGLDTAEDILDTLRAELIPLVQELNAAEVKLDNPLTGTYSIDAQESLAREVLDRLGYDWDRGRLDTAAHPFSVGNQFDARITTRFSESDPLSAVNGTIHEFGHAFYTLGLPDDHYGSPLGRAQGLVVHESQSRLWENHVARSRPFWEHLADTFNTHLGTHATPRQLYEAANQINPRNLIRVNADELTYHLHIVLRFELERDLIRGDLDVEDLPSVWNEKMERYLGVRPDSDANGCLQDIHWSHGSIGYFPTYSLGSVLAAQLDAAAREAIPDLDAHIRKGNFDPLAEWLQRNIHQHGQRYPTNVLIEQATGERLTAEYFIDYATSKFRDLYDS